MHLHLRTPLQLRKTADHHFLMADELESCAGLPGTTRRQAADECITHAEICEAMTRDLKVPVYWHILDEVPVPVDIQILEV